MSFKDKPSSDPPSLSLFSKEICLQFSFCCKIARILRQTNFTLSPGPKLIRQKNPDVLFWRLFLMSKQLVHQGKKASEGQSQLEFYRLQARKLLVLEKLSIFSTGIKFGNTVIFLEIQNFAFFSSWQWWVLCQTFKLSSHLTPSLHLFNVSWNRAKCKTWKYRKGDKKIMHHQKPPPPLSPLPPGELFPVSQPESDGSGVFGFSTFLWSPNAV